MCSGGATRVVATWCVLIGEVICTTLGFPAVFQFFGPYFLNLLFLSFLPPLFPISLIIALSLLFSILLLQLFRSYSSDILWIFLRLCHTFSRCVSLFLFFYFLFLHNLLQVPDFSFLFPLLWLFFFSSFWDFSIYLFLLRFFWVSMVSSSEVRIACPPVSFLFARLRGSLGVFPNLKDFVF